jgi:hypothetical protein
MRWRKVRRQDFSPANVTSPSRGKQETRFFAPFVAAPLHIPPHILIAVSSYIISDAIHYLA